MSDLKDQEQLRDSIIGMLELSRASWKTQEKTSDSGSLHDDQAFPRSMLFKTLHKHPLLAAATVASVWYLGPAKFGTMAVAGASLFMRHHIAILPIAQHFISTTLSKNKGRRSGSNIY